MRSIISAPTLEERTVTPQSSCGPLRTPGLSELFNPESAAAPLLLDDKETLVSERTRFPGGEGERGRDGGRDGRRRAGLWEEGERARALAIFDELRCMLRNIEIAELRKVIS